ncbi:tetratricopeptide repeat protein [Algoriphagus sp.]|uniref:tetratricopeptide repeat protein n=1 Tax=Algoriphagus sp. TaxID=1872435 RepID=UPI00260AD236|nr:tetratricopeptide repeat protein [Algoriphagus sp.]
MPNLPRIKLLEQFIKEEPENPFNWYALALEYQKINHAETKDIFLRIRQQFPTYLPLYYTAAEYFEHCQDYENAAKFFREGIHLAKNQSNAKALRELQNRYQNFLFENDLNEE